MFIAKVSRAPWALLVSLAVSGSCCAAADGPPVVDFELNLVAAQRAEFELRYGYADWPGRDGTALQIGRFFPTMSSQDVAMAASPLHQYKSPHYATGNSVAVMLHRVVNGNRVENAAPIFATFRVFQTPERAHDALMARFSSLHSAPANDPPTLPWGEVRIENVGDVCFHTGADKYDCITGNVWFTVSMGQPPEGIENPDNALASRLVEITAALSQNLRDADAQVRAGTKPPGTTLTLRPAIMDYHAGRMTHEVPLEVVGEAPTQVATLNERGQAFVALAPIRPADAPAPVFERFAASNGHVRHLVNETDGSTYVDGILFSGVSVGPQTVYYIAQYEDGSFEFTQTAIDVLAP